MPNGKSLFFLLLRDSGPGRGKSDIEEIRRCLSGAEQVFRLEIVDWKAGQKSRGAIVKKHWQEAREDILMYADSTVILEPALLGQTVRKLGEGCGVISGSRSLGESRGRRTFIRRWISSGYNGLIRTLFGVDGTDAQCHFKAMTQEAAQRILPLVESQGSFFDTELMALAARTGDRKTDEVPVTFVDPRENAADLIRYFVEDIVQCIRLRFRLKNLSLSKQSDAPSPTLPASGEGIQGPLIFCNAVFLLYGLHWVVPFPQFPIHFLMALLTFVVPGLAWLGVVRSRDGTEDILESIFKTILLSSVILVFSFAVYSLFRVPAHAFGHFIFLFVVTNAAFFFRKRGIPTVKSTGFPLTPVLIFLVVYSVLYAVSLKMIPALEDNDLELQGTAYGLAREFKPFLLTDRKMPFYFAHPPLVHFYAVNFFVLSDRLPDVRYFYDFAKEAQTAMTRTPSEGEIVALREESGESGEYRIAAVKAGTVILDAPLRTRVQTDYRTTLRPGERDIPLPQFRDAQVWDLIRREYAQFSRNPHIPLVRLPHVFFGALTAVFLFYIVVQRLGSGPMGLLSVLVYFSFPVVLVSTSSEIYTAVSNFALLAMFWFFIRRNGPANSPGLFWSGIFAGLVNQKLLIFPVAIVLARLWQRFVFKNRDARTGNGTIVGFAAGTALFWFYGCCIDPKGFFMDHIRMHLVDRILHINTLGYGGYATILELWAGFLSPLFLAVSIPLTLGLLIGRGEKESPVVAVFWFLAGAVCFSWIDWRETTHLMLVALPLVIGTVFFLSRQKRWLRTSLVVFLAFVVLNNLFPVSSFMEEFSIALKTLGGG